jgi:putative MATE family efflux protein
MARTKDLTEGSVTKLILLFALPIIAGNLFQQMYNLVDTLVIGRIEGVTALAAVSSAGWLDWAVLSIAMGLSQGFAIMIAQRFGAQDQEGLKLATGQSIMLSVAVIVILEAVSQLLLVPILHLLNTPEDTFDLTVTYLRIIFGGIPMVMGFNLFSGFLRSVGDSRTPLVGMVCAAVSNIVLDILFVAEFHWSVAGVAIATIMGQGLAFVICLVVSLKLPMMKLQWKDVRPDLPEVRRLLLLGLPIAFQNLIIAIGGLVLQGVVNAEGFIFMAGYSAASKLQGLVEVAGNSLGSAVGTFAGQNLGAGKLDRVKKGLRRSAQIGVLLAILVAAIVLIWGKPLLGLFVDDEPDVVEQVLRFGYNFLAVMGCGLFSLYLLFVYRSTLQGLGDTLIPMASGVMELIMRVLSALILPKLWGEWGIYLAEILAWIGAAILLIFGYYHRIHQLEKRMGEKV